MPQTSIIVKNITIARQNDLWLNDISFSLERGEHLLITGSSGSGKTTLAKVLANKIFYKGSSELSMGSPRVVFVEQHYYFKTLSNTNDFYYQQRYNSFDSDDALTVGEELLKISNDGNAVDGLLSQLNLSYRKNDSLLHLSSGEHKRFQLIRAFLQDADVFIFDSPFTGLDAASRKGLQSLINQKSLSSTIVLIADIDDVPSCITNVAELEKGCLKNFGLMTEFEKNAAIHFHGSAFNGIIPSRSNNEEFNIAVKFENVSVNYDDKIILSKINWQVNQNEKWLVKGANGAGKSTLISLITGDHPQAYANNIILFDKKRGSGESIWDIKKRIGYVSPELHWYFDKTISVFNTIASGFFDTIGVYRILNGEQREVVYQWLSFLNIQSKAEQPLYALSSSQQRLALLARALVKNPSLLILDEPCQGLDDKQVTDFVTLVDELCDQSSKTLIYVSHYENEIPSCVSNVLLLEDGREKKYSVNSKKEIAIAV